MGRPAPLSAPALWVFTWNNSTAAVGREQGPGKERERDGEPKMDMANLFKHFFREFLKLSLSSVVVLEVVYESFLWPFSDGLSSSLF